LCRFLLADLCIEATAHCSIRADSLPEIPCQELLVLPSKKSLHNVKKHPLGQEINTSKDKARNIHNPDFIERFSELRSIDRVQTRGQLQVSSYIFTFANRSNEATDDIAQPSASPKPLHPRSGPIWSAQFCRNHSTSAAQRQQSAYIVWLEGWHMLPAAKMDYTKTYSAHERWGGRVG
jgi:hypothetical protein